jgi:hypothetical protein
MEESHFPGESLIDRSDEIYVNSITVSPYVLFPLRSWVFGLPKHWTPTAPFLT